MNRLPIETRARIIGLLVGGNSLRAAARLVGCSINTVTKLLVDAGTAATAYHDAAARNLRVRRIQCDEIWSFVGARAKNTTGEQRGSCMGDVWTWVALDSDSKLCVSYLVGGRDGGWAYDFMCDVAARLKGRVQATVDGHAACLNAAEGATGLDVDFATLHKIYGEVPRDDERRYGPARCAGSDMKTVTGNSDPTHVSTSFVERQNLTMRMPVRRFARLTNAFSKKLDHHAHAVALHFLYYNFGRVHKSLRVTPAMEAGIADHVWTLEEIAELPDGERRFAA